MKKSEKYQKDEVMITRLVVYQILLISLKKKKKNRLIAADLSKEKALDADSRAIQWITFTRTVKTTAIIYYNLEQSYNFLKEQQKFCNQYQWLNTIT